MNETVTASARDQAVNKSLYLWAAALAITWLSGIEPTWRRLSDSLDSFRSSNQDWQEIDRQAKSQQLGLQAVLGQVERVKWFEKDYPTPAKRDDRRQKLANDVRKFLNVVAAPTAPSASAVDGPDCGNLVKQAEEMIKSSKARVPPDLSRSTQLLANFCSDEELLRDVRSLEKRKEEAKARVTTDLDLKAKEQAKFREEMERKKSGSDVDFEMLGIKFKAPPLFAPPLWCLFAVGWLHAGRRAAAADDPGRPKPDKVPGGSSGIVVIILLAAMTFAVQLRVSWIGLSLTQFEGGLRWRALVALLLLVTIGCAAFFLARTLLDRASVGALDSKWTSIHAWGAMCICALLLSAPALAPGAVLRVAHHAEYKLLAVSVWAGLAAAVWLWTKKPSGNRCLTVARRFVVVAAAALIVGLVRATPSPTIWRRESRYPQRRERIARRRERLDARTRAVSPLPPGFYQHLGREGDGETILHYIRRHGELPVGARLPAIGRLTLVKKLPEYTWLGAKSKTQFLSWTSARVGFPSSCHF